MMYNPPHPGGILKEELLDELGLTVTEAANHLNIARLTLSRVLNCRAAISINLALRLEKAGLNDAEFWLKLQQKHDLWQARQNNPLPNVLSLEQAGHL
ncbi:HigA family addiction module antitoxin [Bartonella sp. 1-1C]|uniref:HigA family addiction module antitoxin n=1 Tax=Bartonella sp. 1-1C TaxID=515256 RepID=UPI0001F4C96F|nr:HigA family addiction module antitoxin [Bartonella sp. 1-1C]ATO56881.1 addiction module antidote protein, HigA family [Bartonella sp. 1-1C]CBI80256.1 virulence-associated protein [Bartonella sp. 1-1C]